MAAPFDHAPHDMPTRGRQHSDPSALSALDALLRAEQAVAERVERARAEAAALIADATELADVSSREAAEALGRELAALDAAHEEALADIARDVAREAADLVVRYRTVTAGQADGMADVVLAELSGLSFSVAPRPSAP